MPNYFSTLLNHRYAKSVRNVLPRFLPYVIIGSASAGFDVLVFTVMTAAFPSHIIACNAISTHCGILLSFILNSKYNFEKTDNLAKRFACFYSVGLCGMILSSIIILIGNYFGIHHVISKISSIFFVTVFQFLMNALVTFRK